MDLGLAEVEVTGEAEASGGDKKLRRMVSTFDTSSLSREEVTMLNSCLEHIADIVGETVPEYTIKETIVKFNYDTEKVLE